MKILLLSSVLLSTTFFSFSQTIDTIAIQDFEAAPMVPTWNYTGTLAGTQSGYAGAGTTNPGSELGINGSTSWHVVEVSAGNPIIFDNTVISPIYDSVFVSLRIAAINLNGTSGGPDNLDYVLVEYSTDGGQNYVERVRVRGPQGNNGSWGFNAFGQGIVDYLPATEDVFQPMNSGLSNNDGVSFVQIGFPGTVGQVMVRVTPRSSSASDHWLVDNVLLTGKTACVPSVGQVTETVCDSYTGPSGAVFTTTGLHADIVQGASGCDSIVTIDLTVNQSDLVTDVISACGSHTWIDGQTYTASNNISNVVLTNAAGCDSVVQLDLIVNPAPDNTVTQAGTTLLSNSQTGTYQWLDCDNSYAPIAGETNLSFSPTNTTGNYAVEVTLGSCTDTSSCYLVDFTGLEELNHSEKNVVKIVDVLGRETEFRPNTPLIYIYSDGTLERVIKLEE